MSLSITICYTWKFTRFNTYGNTATKLADNELGLQGHVNHQLPSSMENFCCPFLMYPMTIPMHINIPSFPGLWHHPPLVRDIVMYFILISIYSPSMSNAMNSSVFFTVACLYLSDDLGFDVGGLTSSSVPP